MAENFRPMSDEERAIAMRLLEAPFPGRDEARAQLEDAEVRRAPGCEEHCGTLEIRVDSLVRIPDGTPSPLPAEGRWYDSDDMPVDVLLFHQDGFLGLLEFVVYSDRIKGVPTASKLEVLINPSA
jgi:hypothetical protein